MAEKALRDFQHIKRVIDGVAYNTETSTKLHSRKLEADSAYAAEYGVQPEASVEELFQTRAGRFYFVYRQIAQWDSLRRAPIFRDEVVPTTRENAAEWMKQHAPESQLAFVMNLKFVTESPPSQAGTVMSLRVASHLKERVAFRAKLRGKSTNAYIEACLHYCIENDIDTPPPPPSVYVTNDDGTRLLTDSGLPGIDAIQENGDPLQLLRAECAAAMRDKGHGIPPQIRKMLINILSLPEEDQTRAILLNDVKRWLELYERKCLKI